MGAQSRALAFLALQGIASSVLFACGGEQELPEVDLAAQEQTIVGGEEAPEDTWRSVVSVTYKPSPAYPWHCGGTLVAPTWVVTAAHCVYGDPTASNYEVIVGRHDITTSEGQLVNVARVVIHPSYVGDDNDIALLELSTAVNAPLSRLVSLPRMSEIRPGDDTRALGWGDLAQGGDPSETLQIVSVDVVGIGAQCLAASEYDEQGATVTDNEICIGDLAGGHDTCQGDSGGPVFVRRDGEWFLIGVTSWGFGCALPELPGVYTFTPNYLRWVYENTPGSRAPSLLPSAQILASLSAL
jgi:secreted trypsin-like serine protease